MFIGIRNLVQVLFVLIALNIVLSVSGTSDGSRRHPATLNNQRSADSGYKYAWFTRDIHDETYSDEENNLHRPHLSLQEILRLKLLQNLIHRQLPKHDEVSSESNEKL